MLTVLLWLVRWSWDLEQDRFEEASSQTFHWTEAGWQTTGAAEGRANL